MERQNFIKNVPRLIRENRFPPMLNCVLERNLGGIAYAEVGSGEGLPPSFADLFVTGRLKTGHEWALQNQPL